MATVVIAEPVVSNNELLDIIENLKRDNDLLKKKNKELKKFKKIFNLKKENDLLKKDFDISDDFHFKLDSLPKNKKKPYQEILDRYDIKYAKSATIEKLKNLILKNKEEKNIQIDLNWIVYQRIKRNLIKNF